MSADKSVSILIMIPNLGRGGAQIVFRQQLKELAAKHEVWGCVFNWDGAFQEDHQENIVSLNVPAGANIFFKIYYFFLRVIRLRSLKRRLKINVSISHLEGADYVNILSSGSDETVCWIHGTKEFDKNISGWLGFLRMRIFIPFLYTRASKLITVSTGIRDELLKNFQIEPSEIQTIYNGFDIDGIKGRSIEPLPEAYQVLFSNCKTLITHCRLSRQKNLTALLRIFKGVNDHSEIKLVIAGDGELREDLLKECEDLQLKYWACWSNFDLNYSSDVYFIGQQDNPFKYLRHASLYIMTSDWEGFPLALCEAMVCGLKVVTSDCYTGPREIIAQKLDLSQPVQVPFYTQYGVLMPLVNSSNSNVVQLWAEETVKLINETSIGQKSDVGINRISQFDISESTKQTTEVLNEILK